MLGNTTLVVASASILGKQMQKTELKELAKLFLELGCTSFGGPAVAIALMQKEVVAKRQWMTEQHFLDLVGATNLIPGPNSTEMAIHIGRERAGWKGLLVAGLCFILPAVLITAVFAWFYKAYGQLPAVKPFIYGIAPAIIAVILKALVPLAQKALKTKELAFIGLAALILSFLHANEIWVLFGAGFLGMLLLSFRNNNTRTKKRSLIPFAFAQVPGLTAGVTNANLFFIFLKIGAVLYGSGYVLFAFMDSELVSRGLLTRHQLVDAIAVGQFTPGPVLSSVTFVGYQLNGLIGALVSTIAVFLPSFVFVALLNPFVKKMRNSPLFSAFLDAVNIASVAIIAAVCFAMGRESILDWRTAFIAAASLILLLWFKKLSAAWIVMGGALLGFLLTYV